MKKVLMNWFLNTVSGDINFTPDLLGTKLRSWVESDGLVNNESNDYGNVSSGDVVQWSDLSGNNNHWITSGNRPSFDGTKVIFDKTNSEGLINTSLFSDSGDNAEGELIVVAQKLSGENIFPFTASRPLDTNKRCLFGVLDSDDKLYLQIKDGLNGNVERGSILFLNAGKFITSFRTTDSYYGIMGETSAGDRLDHPLLSTGSGGIPANAWFGDVAPENFCMMKLLDSSSVYYSGYVYAFFYCNAPLTLVERNNLFCYLGNKYI